MADDEKSSRDDRAESKGGGGGGGGAVVAYRAADSGGFFTIHKRGQGYWTRMGTALGAALIAFLFAEFTWGRLKVAVSVYKWPLNTWAMLGISLGVFAALMLFAWRMMNKPSNVDFLIATDSEMKKVNWTTRKELIGSTKVVVLFMLLTAFFLFAVDWVFHLIFYLAHVLKVPPPGIPGGH